MVDCVEPSAGTLVGLATTVEAAAEVGPARLFSLKVTLVKLPEEAVIAYVTAVVLAVKTGAVARPLPFVVAVVTPPANVPLAPELGTAKLTTVPNTGLPNASSTVTPNGVVKAVPIVALWGVPAVADMVAAGPATIV